MTDARRAGAADAEELVRLRRVMYADADGELPEPAPWQRAAAETLRRQLAEPGGPAVAFVVDKPDQPGELAACAIGAVDWRLPGPTNPVAEVGYVLNVATDVDSRRRGYARACMVALLAWYRDRGVWRVDLRASAEAEPLYRSLGFAPLPYSTLRWTMDV